MRVGKRELNKEQSSKGRFDRWSIHPTSMRSHLSYGPPLSPRPGASSSPHIGLWLSHSPPLHPNLLGRSQPQSHASAHQHMHSANTPSHKLSRLPYGPPLSRHPASCHPGASSPLCIAHRSANHNCMPLCSSTYATGATVHTSLSPIRFGLPHIAPLSRRKAVA